MNHKNISLLKERRRDMNIRKIENIVKDFTLIFFISMIITFVPLFKVHASSTTPIVGRAQLTQDQAFNYFRTRNSEKSDQAVKNFISIVWQEANLEGIKPDVAFMQIMKETNFLRFTGDVKECQNNFAGIGATGGGVSGAYFKDTRTGVRAVVQHLKAYCSTEGLRTSCVDPRFTYVKRGISPYVEWLGIGENPNYPDQGWAADNNYGKSIASMMQVAKNLSSSHENNIDTVQPNYKAKIQTYDIMEGNKYITDKKLEVNKLYTIKGYASSENGVLYEFWAKDVSTGVWAKIREYKEDRYANWTPNKSGQYIIKVNVKDKNSNLELDGKVEKTFTVIAGNTKPEKAKIQTYDIMEGNKYITDKKLEVNKLYTIKGYASSENGVLYEFWAKNESEGNWIKIKDYSSDRCANWTPNKSGQYIIKVNVKDKNSNLELDGKVEKTFMVIPKGEKPGKAKIQTYDIMEGNKYVTSKKLDLNKKYTIKAYASSSNGVLYEFWIKDVRKGNWVKIRDYKEDRLATFSVSNQSSYIIKVNVKDKYSLNSVDSYVEKNFTIGDLMRTIVLDAGHGGRDSGALSSQATGRLHEADIVQKITIKLGNLLKKAGYNVIYTRDKIDLYNYPSVTQNLEDRINVANSIKADLFMSIHADSFDVSSANGYSAHYSSYRPKLDNSGIYEEDDITYDKTPCDAALKSKVLSQLIVNEMSSLGGSNRGISDHNLYVTKNALMPSVLVETGFVSNDAEVRKLNSDSYQNQIAQKLYNAVTKLFNI
ncbi:N-acetylmuramoyl-L-alanine amidase [Clostridium sporogenes]|uniref:N-acetylmuramoyl-L-alanine amidase n=1 Tax=Clostridium sporogenes TaxID=1509 RepID=UPI0013D8D8B0|nr:N-acetylmuramoyl-L-alanine amidase [Clostridium sporogenes]NFE68769.1 N-acetylmuramoyl-L-alanine amidase [Clostridium sporogenes]